MQNEMTEEMIDIAGKLHELAAEYRTLYKKVNSNNDPVIWIRHNDTGETVVIADGFNAQAVIEHLTAQKQRLSVERDDYISRLRTAEQERDQYKADNEL
jgi:hypothetical protein